MRTVHVIGIVGDDAVAFLQQMLTTLPGIPLAGMVHTPHHVVASLAELSETNASLMEFGLSDLQDVMETMPLITYLPHVTLEDEQAISAARPDVMMHTIATGPAPVFLKSFVGVATSPYQALELLLEHVRS